MTAGGTVVCGLDGSKGSLLALETAIGLAERESATLVVAFIRQFDTWLAVGVPAELLALAQDDAECAAFMTAACRLDRAGLTWRFAVGSGDPARELQRVADRCDARMLIVGTRGAGWRAVLHRLLAGSVSHRLTAKERRPVLVIHEQPSGSSAVR